MLAKIQYGAVGAALLTLVLGFFQSGSNLFLFISIFFSVLALVLTFVSWVTGRKTEAAPSVPATALATDDLAGDLFEDAETTTMIEPDDAALAELSLDDDEDELEPVDLTSALDELDAEDEEEEIEVLDLDDEIFEPAPKPRPRAAPARIGAKPAAPRSQATKAAAAKAPAARKPAGGAAKAAPKAAPKAAAKSAGGKVSVVPGRERYHTAGCRFVQGRDGVEEITLAAAKKRGYQACSACKPG